MNNMHELRKKKGRSRIFAQATRPMKIIKFTEKGETGKCR